MYRYTSNPPSRLIAPRPALAPSAGYTPGAHGTHTRRILRAIENDIAASGMSPSSFGRLAAGDPRLVFDMRAGRQVREVTLKKIEDFLQRFDKLPHAGKAVARA